MSVAKTLPCGVATESPAKIQVCVSDEVIAKTQRHWCLKTGEGLLGLAKEEDSEISQMCPPQKAKVKCFYAARGLGEGSFREAGGKSVLPQC